MAQFTDGFFSPTKGFLNEESLISEILLFFAQEPESYYKLVIGSDSQVKHNTGRGETDFVTAIIIHRSGKGARYFWKKERLNRVPELRERIYTETQKSLSTAHELVPKIRELTQRANCALEIHIDVGERGRTREMIKEIVGMVTGNGFIAKTKPESWGASSVADRHT